MKTVIIIEEDNHGLIGIVKNEKDIVDFLVNTKWLKENTDIDFHFNEETHHWDSTTPIDKYGNNWVSELKKLNFSDLCDLFNDRFYFSVEEIWSVESN